MNARSNEERMVLSFSARVETGRAHASAVDDFMASGRANVVGLAEGIKWKKGLPTGEPALLVLVTQKLDKSQLRSRDLAPARLGTMQTDVLSVGHLFAGGCEAGIAALAARVRPARGGYSVGHKNITAGTIAAAVYDILPGGTVSPPKHGIGIPAKYYLLSNNHVLANSNTGAPGDAILQPGAHDGGTDPADRIAALSRFIPITLDPPVPLAGHNNLVDCALAEVPFADIDRGIYWSGAVRGWRLKANVQVGLAVKKTGRTTHFTAGRITGLNGTIDVNYGSGKTARFKEQIVLTPMSAGGDSGSLVLTLDDVAIGLLFAGSSQATIANQIENVRALLKVEVAELIL